VWQSNYVKNGRRETSYGPFQLLVGGGLGDVFRRMTGLDPKSKASVFPQIDFALNHAAQNGWGSWYGAAKVGVDKWTGLRGAAPAPINPEGIQIATANLPNDVPVPMPRPQSAQPSRPITPTPAPTAVASAPVPERFGPSAAPSRGSGTSAPVMAGFTPDPSRFGRVPMAPSAAPRGDRVGSGSFSAPPDPARFAPSPSVPSPALRMAPGPVDPARFGQVPIAHLAPNPAPARQMASPRSMEGPGGIVMDMVPDELRPVPMAPVQPPAPPMAPPVTVQNMPVHQVEAGAPPMVPQAPRPPASGNTVEMDQFGNRSVTNKYGATTITGPGGNQSFGSLNMGQASSPSIPSIPGPLGNPFAGMLGEGQPQGFGKTLGGGLMGARMGAGFGLPGLAVGGLLGGLLGRELSKPGGGRLAPLASALGIGQPQFATGFPAAPKAPPAFQPMTEAQHRDFLNSPGIRESAQAQSALSRGGGGLY
jgi:hypothetical protein